MKENKFPNGCECFFYPEGTVGALIELLKKEDPNKQVFYVETHYDDYSCGDGISYNFSQITSLNSLSIKDSIALQGDRKWEYENEIPPNIYSLDDVGTIYVEDDFLPISDNLEWKLDPQRIYRYRSSEFICSYKDKEEHSDFKGYVKVVTGHYNFKEVVTEMTVEQAYLWLLENGFVGEEF